MFTPPILSHGGMVIVKKSSKCCSLNEISFLQIQALKVLVNLSSNPDMMDDIVQAQVRRKHSVVS